LDDEYRFESDLDKEGKVVLDLEELVDDDLWWVALRIRDHSTYFLEGEFGIRRREEETRGRRGETSRKKKKAVKNETTRSDEDGEGDSERKKETYSKYRVDMSPLVRIEAIAEFC